MPGPQEYRVEVVDSGAVAGAPGSVPEHSAVALLARRRMRVALGALLALMVALVAIGWVAADRLYTTAENHYVQEAFPLRDSSRDLILQMLNEETGVRGYLITGDRDSLKPYGLARARVAADLAASQRLTARRPEIAADVADARRRVRVLDDFFTREIDLVESGRAGQVRAQRNVLNGKARFEEFRLAAGSLLDRSEHIVHQAQSTERHTFWRASVLVFTVGAAAIAIGLALLLFLPERMRRLYQQEADARRAAERGDRASRALAQVVDAVVLLDNQGTIRHWNPAAERSLGVPADQAIDRLARDVIPEFPGLTAAGARGGDLVPVSVEGRERWFAVRETRFPEGAVLVLRDVTAEQQLERARSEFLATASHELRTPLAAVYGAVRTLRRPDLPEGASLRVDLLAMIEEESARLNFLIDRILVSAQLDRRELRLHRETCDVHELCESVVASAELRSPGVTIALDAPESVSLECDSPRLRQVLVNLVDNAIKYSDAGGHVELCVRETSGRVRIAVVDDGIGIPRELQSRVFEKFYRADPDMISGIGGSGLGLYISHELVEQMGGRLSVSSRVGAGSVFTIELPHRVLAAEPARAR
ncbi:MAG: ATP-binding protein [Gaiellaceae bacterium]